MPQNLRAQRLGLAALVFAVAGALAGAQTRITAPENKFDPREDVQIGRQAAGDVRREVPLLRDDRVSGYVARIGRQLVAQIPAEFQHPEFEYTFEVVDAPEINAFALPGGPMFLNGGMILAAQTEGEVAGVMAHEISHVALRHGTAQASKAGNYQLGATAGQILGAILGGPAGAIVAESTQFGLGVAFLRFSRAYEKDADILGAQIMARAGYDPIDMANMFRTIAQEGGGGGPEWLKSHPNPDNRSEYITAEARMLRISNRVASDGDLRAVQRRLQDRPAAGVNRRTARSAVTGGRVTPRPVEPPASSARTYRHGGLSVTVPANWRERSSAGGSLWFAPEGAYAQANGAMTVTHGIQFGTARAETSDLSRATGALVDALARSNPDLRRAGSARRTSFASRDGLRVPLRNRSRVTGDEEVVTVYSTMLDEGTLFYAVAVAPRSEWSTYEAVFEHVAHSARVQR